MPPAPVVVDRFWARPEAGPILEPAGFLIDPLAPASRWLASEARSTEDLSGERCLVLLGELGMGKTTAVREHGLEPQGASAECCSFDLSAYGSEDRLAARVFESPSVDAWIAGEHDLCIVLDGFDDAQTRVRNLGSMVADYLGSWPTDRLWLRIVCRSSEWPQSLATHLERSYGSSCQYELLPLRRTDAPAFLPTGVDAEAFLEAVEGSRVGALAARPLTLSMLARAFATEGRLPGTAVDLYAIGLEGLCDESNPVRREAGGRHLTPSQRLEVASRIAAANVFSGRPTVCSARRHPPPVIQLSSIAARRARSPFPAESRSLSMHFRR